MSFEELRWERQASLKQMMEAHNRLVDEVAQLNNDVGILAETISKQSDEMAERLHELNDKILTVNYKTDEMRSSISDKLNDLLQRINRNHPAG